MTKAERDILKDARIATWFNKPPFTAKLFSKESAWCGVMNANDVNCLTFKNSGATITHIRIGIKIAESWNNGEGILK